MNTMTTLTTTPPGNKYISWSVRILLMLMIGLFFMFSLDVFDMGAGEPLLAIVKGFLVHNTFTFALFLILAVCWKWEHFGGVLLIGTGIFMAFFFGGPAHLFDDARWILVTPPIPLGLLLLFNHYFIGRSKQN